MIDETDLNCYSTQENQIAVLYETFIAMINDYLNSLTTSETIYNYLLCPVSSPVISSYHIVQVEMLYLVRLCYKQQILSSNKIKLKYADKFLDILGC